MLNRCRVFRFVVAQLLVAFMMFYNVEATTSSIRTYKPKTKENKTVGRKVDNKRRIKVASRGYVVRQRLYGTVTAYTLAEDECGKKKGEKGYGITYTGTKATVYRTVAVDKDRIPLGSKIYIPYFSSWPNRGVFIAEDTGSGNFLVDIFVHTKEEAYKIGRKQLEIYILEEDF